MKVDLPLSLSLHPKCPHIVEELECVHRFTRSSVVMVHKHRQAEIFIHAHAIYAESTPIYSTS